MEDREPLLRKGRSPNGSYKDQVISENFQGRRYETERPSFDDNGYYSTANSPAMVVQPGLFQGNPVPIETNQLQGSQLVPSDYSGYAWLSLLFCCFPLAVAAIYKSDKVMKCIRRGDIDEAWKHSVAAKKLSALAIIYGILIIVVGIALYFTISTEVTHTL
ncbi:proline rich transmembrane protein 1B-like [Clytia hemisphaerica]|uniref:Uncharacterized protein n=1 Tax=Clytia hemisphaerica TaxID=252671 RepID=A0A7M5XLY9_9CNID